MKSKKSLLVGVAVVVLAISELQFRAAAAEPQAAAAALGTYVISCLMEPRTGPSPAPCLTGNQIPVGTPLILRGEVSDSAGNLATSGTLIFQDCLLNGVPAPSVHCDSGTGVWSNVQRFHITKVPKNGPGEFAQIGYGSPSSAQTIGFRFRYLGGQASNITNGICNSMDVTWF